MPMMTPTLAGEPPHPARKLTRVEKNENTRLRLIQAAIAVVGRVGYRDASITDITSEADVAQGTFYTHFPSRQALLDQLLPKLGADLLAYVRKRVAGTTALERESKSLRAYFDFIHERPEFHRILVEAQIYAPDSFAQHVDNLMRSYLASLDQSQANGFLQDYDRSEFATIATLLMGARVYLSAAYGFRGGQPERVPDEVIRTFIRLIANGLTQVPQSTAEAAEGIVTGVTRDLVSMRFGAWDRSAPPGKRHALLKRWSGSLTGQALSALVAPGLPSGRDVCIDSDSSQHVPGPSCASVAGTAEVDKVTPELGMLRWRLFDLASSTQVLAFGTAVYRVM